MNRRPLRFPTVAFVVLLSSTLQLAYGQTTDATAGDPSLSPSNEIVTVAVQDYTVSGLVTRLREPKAFKYGIALFSGHPGIMKLHEENGQPRFVSQRISQRSSGLACISIFM